MAPNEVKRRGPILDLCWIYSRLLLPFEIIKNDTSLGCVSKKMPYFQKCISKNMPMPKMATISAETYDVAKKKEFQLVQDG